MPDVRLLLLLVVLACGCSGFSPREEQCPKIEELGGEDEILAIGDSIFAWREGRCKTVPDVVATTLQRKVVNAAVSGARVTGGDYPITEQYRPGDWDWVLFDGGGNDINNECECGGGCDRVLDALVSEDGTQGEVPTLLRRVREDGARVLVMGYYETAPKAWYGFDECIAELDELRVRYETMAERLEGVEFVDAREAITVEGTPQGYTFDWVHPSTKGAALVGALIAEEIEHLERREAANP